LIFPDFHYSSVVSGVFQPNFTVFLNFTKTDRESVMSGFSHLVDFSNTGRLLWPGAVVDPNKEWQAMLLISRRCAAPNLFSGGRHQAFWRKSLGTFSLH
jgi:hypothetical protein